MRTTVGRITAGTAGLLLFAVTPLAAQGHLGRLDFPNSGSEAAQDAFVRGVLLLHSFEYEDAATAFREAQEVDPVFALAYWGEAMTYNHPLWGQQDRAAAQSSLAKLAPTPEARQIKGQSAREKGYLAAVDVLFGDGEKADRDRAYMAEMEKLQRAYPDDQEAKAFYALSILGSVPERDFRVYMRAGAVAEEVFAANPLHPGAAHYLIHSYDDPIHAPLGLRAARVYATIAPDASHAQHMISHIYTALGLWEEVVVANENAVRVSEERLERMGRSLHGRNKHSLLWLEYALLQQGRFDEARAKLQTMLGDARADPTPGQLWHFAAMRAHYVVGAPARSDVPMSLDLSEAAFSARVTDVFANAILALRRGDRKACESALDEMRALSEAAVVSAPEDGVNAYDGAADESDLVIARIQEAQVEALLLAHGGAIESAIEKADEAAALEAERPLEYGPPSVVKPSYELLGELLLLAGRAEPAKVAFEASLDRAPRRTLSLVGLARAADAAGDGERSDEIMELVREIWKDEASGNS